MHACHGVKYAWNGASSDQGARLLSPVTILDLDGWNYSRIEMRRSRELSGVTTADSVLVEVEEMS